MSEERGAALLEVLLALALTAMLASALAASLRFGLGATDRAQASSSAADGAHADRRRLSALWARMDADAAVAGGPARVLWRGGGGPQERRWGLWALDVAGGVATLSPCAGEDARAPGPCAPGERLRLPAGALSYAGADGVFAPVWSADGPPRLIAVDHGDGRLVVAPRAAR